MPDLLPAPGPTVVGSTRPSAVRRALVALTALVACALPAVWGVSAAIQLVTGADPDHRFHQLTGQGVLLCALWLGAVVPVAVAGWRGRAPRAASAPAHVAVVGGAVVAAALAPGNGGAVTAAIVAGTGLLVWFAVLRRTRPVLSGPDPVLAPLALVTAAVYLPYALSQASAQRAFADEHARLSHYFDMTWLAVLLVVLAFAAAIVPAARRLGVVAMLGSVVVGAAGLGFTSDRTWSLVALALGLVGCGAVELRVRRGVR
jgi:hypothetical protein